MTPYLVTEFQRETLSALIRECFGYEYLRIFDKEQVKYLYNYLSSMGAKSILLEPRYTDRDFLEDYSRYYVKRFRNDGGVCGRLHFFDRKLDHNSLDKMMLGIEPEVSANEPTGTHGEDPDTEHKPLNSASLQESYLGFALIKPLSKTFIGKTCLRITGEPGTGPGTKKKISKRYEVNLFGTKLHVESIAFQEQDKVVAACATTAIWTALHAFPGRDVKSIPSCSEITIGALNFVDGSNNGFPNKHLTHKQIQRSLDVEGLRYHSSTLTDASKSWFKSYVSAHIDSDLPVILAGGVYGPRKPSDIESELEAETLSALEELGESLDEETRATLLSDLTPVAGRAMCLKGGHAITLVGYDFRHGNEWIYVHDDRLGPYARAELVDARAFIDLQASLGFRPADEVTADLQSRWALAFSHWDPDAKRWLDPHEILVPDMGIIPADKKARLDFQFAFGTASVLSSHIQCWMDGICATSELEPQAFRHTIKLSTISQIRNEVAGRPVGYALDETLHSGPESPVASAEAIERWNASKLSFLTAPMARLQWDIDFYWGEKLVLKVLLDATDTPLGDAVSAVYEHDLLYADLFLRVFRDDKENAKYVHDEHFYSSFLKLVDKRDRDYVSHLNKTYGPLRAPKRLEKSEINEKGEGANGTAIELFDPQAGERTLVLRYQHVVDSPSDKNLIWAIGKNGSLFVAVDLKDPKRGHPSMTGLQAARIAGEMWWRQGEEGGVWAVNHSSGRYSFDYANPKNLLANAITKIASFFPDDKFVEESLPERRPS